MEGPHAVGPWQLCDIAWDPSSLVAVTAQPPASSSAEAIPYLAVSRDSVSKDPLQPMLLKRGRKPKINIESGSSQTPSCRRCRHVTTLEYFMFFCVSWTASWQTHGRQIAVHNVPSTLIYGEQQLRAGKGSRLLLPLTGEASGGVSSDALAGPAACQVSLPTKKN